MYGQALYTCAFIGGELYASNMEHEFGCKYTNWWMLSQSTEEPTSSRSESMT